MLRVITSQLDWNWGSIEKSLGGPFTPKLLVGEGQGVWHGGYLIPGGQCQAAVGTENMGVNMCFAFTHTSSMHLDHRK